MRPALSTAAALAALLSASCAPIEAEPPRDADGEVIAQPEPFDAWLRLSASQPSADGTIALRPTITLTFSDYLNDESFTSYSAVSLASNGLRVRGVLRYQMTTKSLIWTASRALEPGLVYTLEVDPSALRSVTDAPPDISWTPPRLIADASAPTITAPLPDADAPVTFADVSPIFEARCNGCHDDPAWQLPALTRGGLVGAPSAQVDRVLVRPFDPSDSYLMHKLLPDYADRRFGAHPPRWHDDPTPLTTEQLWRIEQWIAQGAGG